PLNELNEFENTIRHEDNICAVIIEGIQGIGGIRIPDEKFLLEIEKICKKQNIALILDEVQSGYGRTGKFFYFQYSGIKPDIITTAKGMGNGFPVGGVLISNKFNSEYGMMGTTFGGNHLACAASIAVLNVMQRENLIENALKVGDFLISELKKIPKIKEVRGKGLMIGIEFESDINEFRKNLLFDYKIFTGISGKNVIRLLPPLSLKKQEAEEFLEKFNVALLKEEIIYG
ncbi:MAG: aminotransferase class III-fold pyridoxal phosphate-dependent enzyme, partial [Bacteroidales bacterium]|nr:aminotransferase class III-fold pyridoxal phosphate-dependent enzyme [Bacteroidales bacterium]